MISNIFWNQKENGCIFYSARENKFGRHDSHVLFLSLIIGLCCYLSALQFVVHSVFAVIAILISSARLSHKLLFSDSWRGDHRGTG